MDPCLVPSLACRTVCRARGPTGAPPFWVTALGGVPTGRLWLPRDGLLTCLFPPAGAPRAGSLTPGAQTSIPTQTRTTRASARRLTETLRCPEGHRTCWLMPWAPEGLSELQLLSAWPCPLLLTQVWVWEGDWSVCGQGQLWQGPARANTTGVLGPVPARPHANLSPSGRLCAKPKGLRIGVGGLESPVPPLWGC